MKVFNHYAEYYDLLYSEKNYKAEVDYVDDLIQKYNLGAKTLLDLGCGTGTHGFHFARKKYDVTGIDLSHKMVAIAQRKRETEKIDNISFFQDNITSLKLDKRFDVVISLFHVMNYLTSNSDMKAGFSAAAEHIIKGGIFIFDCWYGPAVLTDLPKPGKRELENKTIKVARNVKPEMQPNSNVVDVNYEIVVEEKQTGEVAKIKEVHSVRYFFKPEIELIFEQVGLEILVCEEWLTSKKTGFDTFGVCFVARKK